MPVSDADFGRDRDRIADVAIDRAVREIMSAEAGPAFRQRVMTRVLSDPAPPRTWLPQLALAAAALVVLIVAFAWPRQEAAIEPATASASLTPQSPAPATPANAPASASSREPGATATAAPVRPAPSITRARVPQPPRGMVEAASIETAAGVSVAATVEAVDAALDAAPLPQAAPGSLRLPAIPFAPIVISEIVIEPLAAGGR